MRQDFRTSLETNLCCKGWVIFLKIPSFEELKLTQNSTLWSPWIGNSFIIHKKRQVPPRDRYSRHITQLSKKTFIVKMDKNGIGKKAILCAKEGEVTLICSGNHLLKQQMTRWPKDSWKAEWYQPMSRWFTDFSNTCRGYRLQLCIFIYKHVCDIWYDRYVYINIYCKGHKIIEFLNLKSAFQEKNNMTCCSTAWFSESTTWELLL